MTLKSEPTRSELKLLQHLWKHGASTVRQVHDTIGKESDVSYTTVLKQLQIMHEKGIVSRETGQRAHLYSPAVARDDIQMNMLDDFLKRVYHGSASKLVLQALGMSKPADAEELEEIEALIKELKTRKKQKDI